LEITYKNRIFEIVSKNNPLSKEVQRIFGFKPNPEEEVKKNNWMGFKISPPFWNNGNNKCS